MFLVLTRVQERDILYLSGKLKKQDGEQIRIISNNIFFADIILIELANNELRFNNTATLTCTVCILFSLA